MFISARENFISEYYLVTYSKHNDAYDDEKWIESLSVEKTDKQSELQELTIEVKDSI